MNILQVPVCFKHWYQLVESVWIRLFAINRVKLASFLKQLVYASIDMIIYKAAYPRARITAISSRVRCFTNLHDIIDSICVSWS